MTSKLVGSLANMLQKANKMKKQINIKVITNAKRQEIKKQEEVFKVYLKSKPEKDKANKELISLLADYFKISKYNIEIIKGVHSKEKVLKIEN